MVHDLAEALVGDITPLDGVSKADKRKLEEVMSIIIIIIIIIVS
jgi:5'-deoxynucleotidase YfbR-like HD superfamily hydrolase